MKPTINLSNIKQKLGQVKFSIYKIIKAILIKYQQLTDKQRYVVLISSAITVLLVIIASLYLLLSPSKDDYATMAIPIKAEGFVPQRPSGKKTDVDLNGQLNQLTFISRKNYKKVTNQLQAIQNDMSSLASQQDLSALQQTVTKPNTQLMQKVNSIEDSVKNIVKQTQKKRWVNPKQVERYFKLIAIQGFSDGMRAIIDVDGNQTALSVNELCPACRHWRLQHMNFAEQTAIFSKQSNHQQLYVKLQAK